jgi:hypothetical protein
MRRRFRYSSNTNAALAANPKHALALRHTLKIFEPNAAYTFIPKNACSTMRFSLAVANGCIDGPDEINWIHHNNPTFAMTTEQAFLADFAFVILRCPFRRLYSVFLDKFVNMDIQSWRFYNNAQRRWHPHDLTFETFVRALQEPVLFRSDNHWAPQGDFLLFDEYDAYFSVEQFDTCVAELKARLDFDVLDARDLTGHSTADHRVSEGDEFNYQTPAFELLRLKREGVVPSYDTMFNEELVEICSRLYSSDIALYKEKLSNESLLYN